MNRHPDRTLNAVASLDLDPAGDDEDLDDDEDFDDDDDEADDEGDEADDEDDDDVETWQVGGGRPNSAKSRSQLDFPR